MLVLSRKKGESIIIDGNIEVTVIAIEGNTLKLGINAPNDIDIHRKEVFLEIQEENKSSISTDLQFDELKDFKKNK